MLILSDERRCSIQAFCSFVMLLIVYMSSPYLTQMNLSGNIDAISSALIVISACVLTVPLGKVLSSLISSLILMLSLAFNLANGLYYEVQQYYFSITTLYLITEIGGLLEANTVAVKAIALSGIFICTGIFFVLARVALPSNIGKSLAASALLFCAYFLTQLYYVKITDEHRFSKYEASPITYFIRSSGLLPFVRLDSEVLAALERKTLIKKIKQSPEAPLPENYSVENIYRLLGKATPSNSEVNPLFPFYNSTNTSKAEERRQLEDMIEHDYNVLIVMLESVRASEMGLYGAESSATPFLDKLGRNAIHAEKFYATTNFTVKSEHAVHCSTYDKMRGSPISKRDIPVRTHCLPRMLRDIGYSTYWFHGNTSSFYNRDEYLPKLGFQEIISSDELNKAEKFDVLGWGMKDPEIFEVALDKLESADGPFYAEILTVSNHMPFNFDWDIEFPSFLDSHSNLFERYRRGIYYTDQAAKEFYKKFKKSKLSENTILIFTGDHGIWTFDDEQGKTELKKNEEFFRVPLIMEYPGSKAESLPGIASHLDIAPTILDILGYEGSSDFLGQSLLTNELQRKSRAIYLLTEQAIALRFEDRACIPTIQCQDNTNCYHTSKVSPPESQCYRLDPRQDVLTTGAILNPSSNYIKSADRALLDFSQMAITLGTAPEYFENDIQNAENPD